MGTNLPISPYSNNERANHLSRIIGTLCWRASLNIFCALSPRALAKITGAFQRFGEYNITIAMWVGLASTRVELARFDDEPPSSRISRCNSLRFCLISLSPSEFLCSCLISCNDIISCLCNFIFSIIKSIIPNTK